MIGAPEFDVWPVAAITAYLAGALCAATVAVWLARRRDRFGPAGAPIVAGLFLTAGWCLAVVVSGEGSLGADVAEATRNLAWFLAIGRLFASDGRHNSLAPVRPVLFVLAGVELLHLGIGFALLGMRQGSVAAVVAFNLTVLFRLLVTVGALVLAHNLFAGASRQSRLGLRWPVMGLAALWACDLNLYTIAYLGGRWPSELTVSRGLAVIVLAGTLAIGGARGSEALRFRPSRAVTFQTFSLLVIGAYLVAMVAVAQWLSFVGGDFARLVELAFLTLASALAILLLPSRRLRGWLKVTLAKHFFQHRYDYREEWLRFTHTIGNNADGALPLGERVVQAVADIAESPAGLLMTPDENGDLTLAARWQWPTAEVPAIGIAREAMPFFERDGFIVDLDDVRTGSASRGEDGVVPQWLRAENRAWALAPLIHYERLVGMVVLARPVAARKFDWEDFDLLRIVGQQLASYLAEHAVQEALAESSRFEDFHRRIAFVMHDIKNLASQLSLLARNAERHADNPAFRDDMLLTLRNSAEKLNTLLARLSRYGGGAAHQLAEIAGGDVARAVVEQFKARRSVVLAECQPCAIVANREALEQVLVHLVQNALDASAPDASVFLTLAIDGGDARFDVVDSGSGMTPDFVRNKLFKPFVSSKPGGFGIGAFEARELVQAMRGRLEVASREGLGSRFTVRLPIAAARISHTQADTDQRLAS